MSIRAVPVSDQSADSNGRLLEIEGLAVRFDSHRGVVHAVNGVDLRVAPGEVLALVGESGSGKSVSALAVMGLLDPGVARVSGSIRLDGEELTHLGRRAMASVRGRRIGMVFQDPMSSLNPVHPIGRQIGESLRIHLRLARSEAETRALELLDQVGIPDPRRRAREFPHQFSGGMRQRVMIAMALACDPALLIADEPTTALDVTVQSQIVELVRRLQSDRNMAVMWITHDLGVVAAIADKVAVMYGGRIVESGSAGDVYNDSRHPYTRGLLGSIPRLDRPTSLRLAEIPGAPTTWTSRPTSCVFHHRCPMHADGCDAELPALVTVGENEHSTACLHADQVGPGTWGASGVADSTRGGEDETPAVVVVDDVSVVFRSRDRSSGPIRAVDGVSLELHRERTLGVVGESGCGKTTLGRAIVGLEPVSKGAVDVRVGAGSAASARRAVQMIFQDPFSSMNPGMRVRDIIAEPIRVHRLAKGSEVDDRVRTLLGQVGLSPDSARRHPHEFSGGQRQRIAVARALAADPEVIVCDEPVSALDVSVQAQIINLLADLQSSKGLSYLFIAHDLSVVRHISHQVAVMYLGRIVERASRDDLYREPLHPYTQALLAAVPLPTPDAEHKAPPLTGDLPSPANPPAGCHFHTRCPVAVERCAVESPMLHEVRPGRWAACHLVEP